MSSEANRAIGEAIRALRKRAGWSQEELARQAGFRHHQIVSAIERGERAVKAAELFRLARLFRVELTDLLQGTTPEHEAVVLWREGPGGTARRETEELFLQRCRRYALVERLAGIEEEVTVPQFTIDFERDSFQRVEEIADQVRGSLQLGEIPGPVLRDALEERWRVKIFPAILDEGSAAITWGDFGPAILENVAESPKRRVFSLAHELFHVITWRSYRDLEPEVRKALHGKGERLANAFASALLLPRGLVLESVSRHRVEQLVDLLPVAQTFNVSLPALLWRLVNLGRLDRDRVKAFLDPDAWWGTTDPGWRPPESLDRPLPERYVNLAFSAYIKGKMTIGKLAELLETSVGLVEQRLSMYGLDLDQDAYQTEVLPA